MVGGPIMSVKVKICGITSVDDARMTADAGADSAGLVFAESPRQIGVETASAITEALSPSVTPVALFVNESVERIVETCRLIGAIDVQLSGTEPVDDVTALRNEGLRVIKAIHIVPEGTVTEQDDMGADMVLLDTSVPGLSGGTGITFDPALVKQLNFSVPVILAGGLTPGNVAARVREIHPYGVDVSSGVESSPGKKNPELVRLFVDAAKGAYGVS